MDDKARYHDAARRMQSGIAMLLNFNSASGTPKHLRVGVNMAMVEHGALVRLLIAKGVFTLAEYEAALAEGTEAEVANYERELAEIMGSSVSLGPCGLPNES